ncbi:MAG: hypothetical protein AAGA70_17565 [Pseudomonadota bacterium]
MTDASVEIAAFEAFDGRRVAPLRALVAGNPDTRRVLDHVPGDHEIAASWVMKALAEAGRLSTADLAGFLARLPFLSEPDAVLHLLQSAQYAPQPVARAMRDDLVALYRHPRGLVRVWAFDAYVRGADLPAERADLAERIKAGTGNRYAAMRARARALAAQFDVEI